MPTTIAPGAGNTFSVSAAAPATNNVAGYGALTWTPVGGVDTIGEIGKMYEMGTFDSLADGRFKFRGILDEGQIDMTPSDMPTDPGHIILKAAFDAARGSAAEIISFRVLKPAGGGLYGRCKISTFRQRYGGAMDVNLRVVTAPVEPGTTVEFP